MCVYIYIYIYVYTHHIYIHIYTYIHVYVCCVYVYIYIYIYAYTRIHERLTGKHVPNILRSNIILAEICRTPGELSMASMW